MILEGTARGGPAGFGPGGTAPAIPAVDVTSGRPIRTNISLYPDVRIFGGLPYPATLPKSVQYWTTWNPLFHSVEWLRPAYYDGYGNADLDKSYLLSFCMIFLLAGIITERALRRLALKS